MTQGVSNFNTSRRLPLVVEPMTFFQFGDKTRPPVTISNRYLPGYARSSWNPEQVLGRQHKSQSPYPMMSMQPDTYITYPRQASPPNSPPVDHSGWQWQPPPSYLPTPYNHPTKSVVVPSHNDLELRQMSVPSPQRAPMSQPKRSDGAYMEREYSSNIKKPSQTSLSPAQLTSYPLMTSLHDSRPAVPRAMQPLMQGATPLPPQSHSWPHISLPNKQAQSWAGRTPGNIGNQSVPAPKSPETPVLIRQIQSTVDAMEEVTIDLLASQCRQLALMIRLRDHPERLQEDWIRLVIQLDTDRPLPLQRALQQDHVKLEFDKVVQQINTLYPDHQIPVRQKPAVAVSPRQNLDMSHNSLRVETNIPTRSTSQTVASTLENPQDLNISKPPVGIVQSLIETPTAQHTVPPRAMEPISDPGLLQKVDELGRQSYREWDQEGTQDLTTGNNKLVPHLEKSDYRYANVPRQGLAFSNGDGLRSHFWKHKDYNFGNPSIPLSSTPRNMVPGPPPPPEPPPSFALSVSSSVDSHYQSAGSRSSSPYSRGYQWNSSTSPNRFIDDMVSTTVDLQENSDTDDDEPNSTNIVEVEEMGPGQDEDDNKTTEQGEGMSDEFCFQRNLRKK
ncbi:hypothetical protein F5878DRAFT_667723 [Lentinula raphanica]|uniref:Uncharacterized protein n=1 Tax=Lentinula raphanica TaxID=153919 RepID=A0AA38U2N6_9AGAR|nr:hypothetical protein F5878DRAFT_667723 [Lentinula raphanica]